MNSTSTQENSTPLTVLIIGGGLGGLALASGLRRAGVAVQVVDRETDLAATGGYHITLHRPVQEALERLLPPEVHDQILASAADGRRREPDVLWDPRGRRIGALPLNGEDRGIDIDRITLRLLLAEAVGTDLTKGRNFTHFERRPDHVIAHFEDGSTQTADVLIGADGVHSRVAAQLATHPTSAPTGIVGISGRTPVSALDPKTRLRLGTRSSLGLGPQATALYLGYLDPAGHAVVDSPHLRRSVTTEPTFIWGAMFAESDRTRDLPRTDSPALLDATVQILTERGWTPPMTETLDRSDPDSLALFRFHAAPPDAADQIPWTAGPVTALGDAVHATPPTAGMGAGAAILDSLHLTEALTAVAHGADLESAIEDYQRGARTRGAEVIAASLPTIRWILATGTPLGSALTRAALPVMATIDALRRRSRSTR